MLSSVVSALGLFFNLIVFHAALLEADVSARTIVTLRDNIKYILLSSPGHVVSLTLASPQAQCGL